MDYVPATMLWLLTLLRIPTLLDRERSPVLRATFLAAVACTLFIPAIYTAADPLLGGHNHVGLLLTVTILAGFWQFHTATVMATFSDTARRRHHLLRGRLAAALAGTGVIGGFLASHPEVTDQNLPLAYSDQPGMRLFLWSGSAFIIWVCATIVYDCWHFMPTLRSRSFRSGVACFASGCIFMALALGNRLTLGLVGGFPSSLSPLATTLNWSFPILETLAVLLVSVGLILPATPTLGSS